MLFFVKVVFFLFEYLIKFVGGGIICLKWGKGSNCFFFNGFFIGGELEIFDFVGLVLCCDGFVFLIVFSVFIRWWWLIVFILVVFIFLFIVFWCFGVFCDVILVLELLFGIGVLELKYVFVCVVEFWIVEVVFIWMLFFMV